MVIKLDEKKLQGPPRTLPWPKISMTL